VLCVRVNISRLHAGTEILTSYVALTWPQFASSSLTM
jgi:hypothetical protein